NPSVRVSAPEQPESPAAQSGDLVPVTDIRQWVTPASTRVVINLEEEVKYEVGRLENPPRIYVDLHGAKINRAVARKTVAVDGGLIKRVRAAQHKGDVTRVVMEMDKLTD